MQSLCTGREEEEQEQEQEQEQQEEEEQEQEQQEEEGSKKETARPREQKTLFLKRLGVYHGRHRNGSCTVNRTSANCQTLIKIMSHQKFVYPHRVQYMQLFLDWGGQQVDSHAYCREK